MVLLVEGDDDIVGFSIVIEDRRHSDQRRHGGDRGQADNLLHGEHAVTVGFGAEAEGQGAALLVGGGTGVEGPGLVRRSAHAHPAIGSWGANRVLVFPQLLWGFATWCLSGKREGRSVAGA